MTARNDVINFQTLVFGAAVGALTMPFLQQIFAYFVAVKRTLLVLNATDFWVLHLLHIKFHNLLRDRRDR